MGKDSEGGDHGLTEGAILTMTWKDTETEKSQKKVRIVDNLTEIRNGYFPNTVLEKCLVQ
jgi:hypothetical protein